MKEIKNKQNMKVALIDLDSICWTACFGVKLLDFQGNPLKENGKNVYRDRTVEEMTEVIDSILNVTFEKTGATHYAGFIKGKNTIDRRLAINPEYKSNRKGEVPKLYATAKKYLICLWKAVEVNGMEVDDMVFKMYNEIPNSFIVAIDQDLLEIANEDRIPHYNWAKQTFITTNEDEACRKFWKDMIKGQPGDGVKGLPGKGEAYFEKIAETLHHLPLRGATLEAYINHYSSEDKGIREFFKTYNSLKLYSPEDFNFTPELIEVPCTNNIPNFF